MDRAARAFKTSAMVEDIKAKALRVAAAGDNLGLQRLQIQKYPGYTLSASGLSSNHQEVVLAKQLSLIPSSDAPIDCEPGLGYACCSIVFPVFRRQFCAGYGLHTTDVL